MPISVKPLKRPGSVISSSESQQISSGFAILQPGEEVGEHETGAGEELIVFMEGKAEVYSGKQKTMVRSPAVVHTPAHTLHKVKNKSKKPVKYVYAYVKAMDR